MKTILITGTTKGIGKALAEKFLSEGYDVIGTGLPGTPLAKNELDLDLSSEESIRTCCERIISTGKKLDILVNNAAILIDEDETSVNTDKLRKTLEVNLTGTIDFTERLIPLLSEGAHIINVSSSAGSLEQVGHGSHHEGHYPAYKISKAALNMYTRTLALRLQGKTIVSSVNPGWTKTTIGGLDATFAPQESAERIFSLAVSEPETGQFWFGLEKMPW